MALSPSFESAFLGTPNQMGFSVLVILAWVAMCDDDLSDDEITRLRSIAAASKSALNADLVLPLVRKISVDDLQLCCEVLRHLPPPGRASFLQMAISTALTDGSLSVGENHVLRFLADLLDLSPSRYQELFSEVAGRAPPTPRDLSDPEQWRTREDPSSRQHGSDRQRGGNGAGPAQSGNAERIRALAVLGLEEGASPTEIRAAYQRLAKVHHPDRFASVGPEAERAATITFQRIKAAYDLLSGT